MDKEKKEADELLQIKFDAWFQGAEALSRIIAVEGYCPIHFFETVIEGLQTNELKLKKKLEEQQKLSVIQ